MERYDWEDKEDKKYRMEKAYRKDRGWSGITVPSEQGVQVGQGG